MNVGSSPPAPYEAGPGSAPALCGPDLQAAGLVEPGDRTAAGADRVDVERRRVDRQPLELGALVEHRLAVDHQRGVEAGATHVDGDQVRFAGDGGEPGGADHAAGRAGQDQVHRLVLGQRRGHRATAGAHHQELATEARLVEAVAEGAQVGADDRLDVGVEHRRARPLVLAVLPGEVRRQRHLDVGGDLARARRASPARGRGWRRRAGTPPPPTGSRRRGSPRRPGAPRRRRRAGAPSRRTASVRAPRRCRSAPPAPSPCGRRCRSCPHGRCARAGRRRGSPAWPRSRCGHRCASAARSGPAWCRG